MNPYNSNSLVKAICLQLSVTSYFSRRSGTPNLKGRSALPWLARAGRNSLIALSAPNPPQHSHLGMLLGGLYKDTVSGPFGCSFGVQRCRGLKPCTGMLGWGDGRECRWCRGDSTRGLLAVGMVVSSCLLFQAVRHARQDWCGYQVSPPSFLGMCEEAQRRSS